MADDGDHYRSVHDHEFLDPCTEMCPGHGAQLALAHHRSDEWQVGNDYNPPQWFLWRRIPEYPHAEYVKTSSGDIRLWKSYEAAERNRVLIERMEATDA